MDPADTECRHGRIAMSRFYNKSHRLDKNDGCSIILNSLQTIWVNTCIVSWHMKTSKAIIHYKHAILDSKT